MLNWNGSDAVNRTAEDQTSALQRQGVSEAASYLQLRVCRLGSFPDGNVGMSASFHDQWKPSLVTSCLLNIGELGGSDQHNVFGGVIVQARCQSRGSFVSVRFSR